MVEQTVVLEVRCQCPGHRRVPIRLAMSGLIALKAALNSHASSLDPETTFQTFKCRACRSVVPVTFRDLMLAE